MSANASGDVFPDECPNCNESAGFHIAGKNPDVLGKCANCGYLVKPTDDTDGVPVEIYHTIWPDRTRESWADATDAERRARDIRGFYGDYEDGADAITEADFEDCYEKVGEDTATGLQDAYEKWDVGLTGGSDAFHAAEVRSMMVGDIIKLDGTYYMVARPAGFNEVPALND